MASRIERMWQGGSTGRRLAAGALSPLSLGLRAAMALRGRLVHPRRVACPVISVGNLSVGGNGKTPLVAELCRRLLRAGHRPAIISRGYGRAEAHATRLWVPGQAAPALRLFGDEAVWYARRQPEVPLVVGADRVAACRRALAELDVDVLVCDDAFQHIRLARDLDLVAVHARGGFGNGRLLPAGPLREPLSALKRAQGLVFTYAEAGQSVAGLAEEHGFALGIPGALCRLGPAGFSRGPGLEAADGCPERVFGLAGIARPQGFVRSAEQAGLQLLGLEALRDHRAPTARKLEDVERRARSAGAQALLCTEKDLVKWPAMPPGALPVFALRQELIWMEDGGRIIDELLEGVFASGRKEKGTGHGA